eukprot:2761171-Rhodomonas_salina.1
MGSRMGWATDLAGDDVAELTGVAVAGVEDDVAVSHVLLGRGEAVHEGGEVLLEAHGVEGGGEAAGAFEGGGELGVAEPDEVQAVAEGAAERGEREAEVGREEPRLVVLVRAVHLGLAEAHVAGVERGVQRHERQLPALDRRALVPWLVLHVRTPERDVPVDAHHARLVVDQEHAHGHVVVQQDRLDADLEVEAVGAAGALQRPERLARVVDDHPLLLDHDAELEPALRHPGERDLGQEQRRARQDVHALVDHLLQVPQAPLLARRVHPLHHAPVRRRPCPPVRKHLSQGQRVQRVSSPSQTRPTPQRYSNQRQSRVKRVQRVTGQTQFSKQGRKGAR